MRNPRLFAGVVFAALLIGAAAAACSGSASAPGQDRFGAEASQAGPQLPAATAAPVAAPADGQGQSNAGNGGSGPAASGIPANITRPEDAIIKTGSIRIEVADLDAAIQQAADTMHSFGAYLSGSERSRGNGYSLGSVTYRVPAARFEDALAQLRKMGKKVISEHSETTPVGGQIVDLQARIDNLKTSEKAVQQIMARATGIPDVLAVESRLSDIQSQIEQLSAQLSSLTDQASYSTLTIEFQVPDPNASPTPTPTPAAGWTFGHELDQAFATLTSIAQGAATVVIWLIVVVLPVALVIVLLLLLGAVLWRLSAPLRRLLPSTTPTPVQFGWATGASGQAAVPAKPAEPSGPTDEPQA